MNCHKKLKDAYIKFNNGALIVQTAKFYREWHWTGHGFLTAAVGKNATCVIINSNKQKYDSDWILPVCEESNPPATLRSACIETSDDDGFTSEHLNFEAHIEYPDVNLEIIFSVWVYPSAPGIRTSICIRANDEYLWDNNIQYTEVSERAKATARLSRGYRRIDYLPAATDNSKRRYFGYHNDTQNRNSEYQDLLLEAVDDGHMVHSQTIEWANACCVETDKTCVALLKESHKCVNQCGHDTGLFVVMPDCGIASHGWGILPHEIDRKWRPAWAGWSLAYDNDEHSRQSAFKEFDKLRFPVKSSDIGIQSNTWGSSQGKLEHFEAASERNVLHEIASCIDLGVEILQIDDGWQIKGPVEWKPSKSRYPHGWKNVYEAAKKSGLKLGLWMEAMPVTLEDMQRNYKEGNFISYKLDFAVLNSKESIDDLMCKVREFIKSAEHKIRINWDLTEVDPRFGYYFAREYGCIYLENRKPVVPYSSIYRPSTVLRDLWQISHYCNLLKFQGSIQNINMVDSLLSDACVYSHAYCVAITLMSSPLFFCETQYYSDTAREEIRQLLHAYKKVRDQIYQGIIYPIGEKPDGRSWTGFECRLSDSCGYFTLFREPGNNSTKGIYNLPHLANKDLMLINLLNNKEDIYSINSDGLFETNITNSGDFRFYRYESIMN